MFGFIELAQFAFGHCVLDLRADRAVRSRYGVGKRGARSFEQMLRLRILTQLPVQRAERELHLAA